MGKKRALTSGSLTRVGSPLLLSPFCPPQNLENLQSGTINDDQHDAKVAKLEQEIATLKNQLEDALGEVREAIETAAQAKKEVEEKAKEIAELKGDLKSALEDNDDVSCALSACVANRS